MREMKNSQMLLSAFGLVDEKYIDECLEIKQLKKRRIGLAVKAVCAAALVLAVSAAAVISARYLPSFIKPANAVEVSEDKNMKTSEKYSSLEELLESVKHNEVHNQDETNSGRIMYKGTPSAESGSIASSAVIYSDFLYHITERGIGITVLSEHEPSGRRAVGNLSTGAQHLLLCGETLVSFRTDYDDPLGGKATVTAEVYDLSVPENPQLCDVFTQSGGYVEAFVANNRVCLATSDGVCACGYSRSSEIEEYMPKIMHNGENIAVSEEDIFILGEPSSIQFTTLTLYAPDEKRITAANAFYGDVKKFFSGSESIVLCVEGRRELYATAPALYVFDIENQVEFAGKVNLSAALDIPEVWFVGSGEKRAEVICAELSGDMCHVIGTVYSSDNGQNKSEIYALSADIANGVCQKAFSESRDALIAIDEIIDAGSRKIVVSSTFDINSMESHARLNSVEFSDEKTIITESSFEIDAVSGVDMLFSYGRPYGEIFPTMLLGENYAVRYNGVPNGMDLFDISNPSDMKLLYSSGNMLGNDADRYLIQGGTLNDEYIAVVKISPITDYRELETMLCVYRICPDEVEKIQLVCEYEIDQCDSVELLAHNGSWYCVNAGYSAPVDAVTEIDISAE